MKRFAIALAIISALMVAAIAGCGKAPTRLEQFESLAAEYDAGFIEYYEGYIEKDAWVSREAADSIANLKPNTADFIRHALDIAMLDPADEAGFQSLQWAYRLNRRAVRARLPAERSREMIDLLIAHHAGHPDVGAALAASMVQPGGAELLNAVLETTTHEAPRAIAILVKASVEKLSAERRESSLGAAGASVATIAEDPEVNGHYDTAVELLDRAIREFPEFDYTRANHNFHPVFKLDSPAHDDLNERLKAYRSDAKARINSVSTEPTPGPQLAGFVLPRNTKEYAERMIADITNLRIGLYAPAIAAPDPGGVERNISDYQGKVLVIDFWATWCAPCVAEIPEWQAFTAKYHGDDVRVLSITADFDREDFDDFVEENPMPWDHWLPLFGHDIFTVWNVIGYPQHFVLDREGRVRARGGMLRDFDQMSDVVDSLLAEAE